MVNSLRDSESSSPARGDVYVPGTPNVIRYDTCYGVWVNVAKFRRVHDEPIPFSVSQQESKEYKLNTDRFYIRSNGNLGDRHNNTLSGNVNHYKDFLHDKFELALRELPEDLKYNHDAFAITDRLVRSP